MSCADWGCSWVIKIFLKCFRGSLPLDTWRTLNVHKMSFVSCVQWFDTVNLFKNLLWEPQKRTQDPSKHLWWSIFMKTINDFKPFDIFANRLHHKSLTNFTQHYQLNCFNVLQKQFHCPKINKKTSSKCFQCFRWCMEFHH